jgi:hypothetical protein
MKTDSQTLDFERDLPTTAEDVRVLRELRAARREDALVHVRRLLAPGWTLKAAAARPTSAGFQPFELDPTEYRFECASVEVEGGLQHVYNHAMSGKPDFTDLR